MSTPQPLLPALPLAGPDEVEAHFYEALRDADIHKLMTVWSDDDDIVCVHPGGPRVVGARAIRASFEAIFARGGIPVQPGPARRSRNGDACVHNVVATNVYLRTAAGWRMVAHHASPGSSQEPREPVDVPATLH
jgi:ketosteroid isomerase-like protein